MVEFLPFRYMEVRNPLTDPAQHSCPANLPRFRELTSASSAHAASALKIRIDGCVEDGYSRNVSTYFPEGAGVKVRI